MSIPSDLVSSVLALERPDREELLRRLIVSLEPIEETLTQEEWEASWIPELEERSRRYESGESKSISTEEFFERMRAKVRQGETS